MHIGAPFGLYSQCSNNATNTYKIYTKLIKRYNIYTKRNKTYLQQKAGLFNDIQNKRIDKCHKIYVQNNYILALINSPQLDTLVVLKQSQVNLKKQNMIIKESRINKFFFTTDNKCMVQTKT